MGAALPKSLQPEELAVFKRLPPDNLLDDIEIPERAENRKSTNTKFLIAFVASLVILMPFMIYTLANSDIRRYRGYDPCGNLCGEVNDKYDEWSCTGKDFTDKKYLQYEEDIGKIVRYSEDPDLIDAELLLSPRKCVENCKNGYTPVFGTCIEETRIDDISWTESSAKLGQYIHKMAWRITLACLLSLAVTLVMLYLFRTCTAAMVWGILIGVLVFGAMIVGACWFFYANEATKNEGMRSGLLYLCIIFTILLVILFCVMAFLHKKIQLVIVLLKECTKAAIAVPQILLVPIFTFIVESIIIALLAITTIYLYSSGILTQFTSEYNIYERNVVMSFTIAFNFVMGLWTLQAVMGIQYMVIAGAISKWYFTKNKVFLGSPLITSVLITFKYHLGSIACGSLVITLIAIIRSFLSALFKNNTLKLCLDHCMKNIEQFLKFLSKNSYILTAMHGEPFFSSGKRAAKIILQNAVNVVAINSIGDFIIVMVQLMIIIISELLAYAIMKGTEESPYVWTVYLIVFIISACIANIFFSIFETIMDTIFLCFCEDSLLNDGMARPYAMSTDLMQFVESSKKLFVKKKP